MLIASGGTLGLTGYHFDQKQGLAFTSPDISGEYTIEVSLSLNNCGMTGALPQSSGRWCKILDFTNLSSVLGVYVDRSGPLAIFLANGYYAGGTDVGDQPRKITMTRSATGFVNIFLDHGSTPEISCNDSAGSAVASIWFAQAVQENEFPAGTVYDIFVSNKARPGPTSEGSIGCSPKLPPPPGK